MATNTQAQAILLLIQEALQMIPGILELCESNPIQARSDIESHVVGNIRKLYPPEFLETLGSTDIQASLDAHPRVPNLPRIQATGVPGVNVISSQNFVTSAELARQMDENNQKLIAAWGKIVAAQNQPQPQQAGKE
jgi:hypothetical protein